jgi:hypothetical protein
MCEHIESCRIKVLRVSGTMAQPYHTRLSAIAQIRDELLLVVFRGEEILTACVLEGVPRNAVTGVDEQLD